MPRRQKVLSACVAAVLAVGSAVVIAQDGGEGQRRAPASGAMRSSAAQAANGVTPAKPAPDPALMKKLLKDWEGQSAKLKTLQVSIYRIDASPQWQEEIHYEGQAAFKSPELAFLDFRKIKTKVDAKGKVSPVVDAKGKRTLIPFDTLVVTGDEVWNYKFDVQQVFIFPLPKEKDKRAIEGGPLPFLFNMKAAEAERRYHMTLLEQTDKKYLVLVEPLMQQDKEDFSRAYVTLDRTYLLPLKILLISPDKKSMRDYRLSNIRPNSEVDPRLFQGVNPGRGWKVVRNPPIEADAAAPKAANAGERRKGAGAQR